MIFSDIKTAIKKKILVPVAGANIIFKMSLAWNRAAFGHDHIIVVNLHDTPAKEAKNFRAILEYLQHHYEFLDPKAGFAFVGAKANLDAERVRPGMVFTFDDGLVSNYHVAAALLEEFGTHGVFLIPNVFISEATAPTLEEEYKRASDLTINVRPGSLDAAEWRCSMTWDQVRELARRKHLIGCHTENHYRLGPDVTGETIACEVVKAKERLESELNDKVTIFCWVGGETQSYSATAVAAIRNAGFNYSLMSCLEPVTRTTDPHHIQRINIETNWSLDRIRAAFSLPQQLRYRAKMRYIASLDPHVENN